MAKYWLMVVCVLVLLFSGCSSKQSPAPEEPARTGSKPGDSGKLRPYSINGKTYYPRAHARGFVQEGKASWYGKDFHGKKTANGETYNMYAMTAAHKTLPLGTWVRVTNKSNNRTADLRINDRGPFVEGRIIDLSYTAAATLGVVGPGTAPVTVTALGKASDDAAESPEARHYTPVDYWSGNFTVQVGAFKEEANADKLTRKLSAHYPNAHTTRYTDARGTFHRVRVGRFSDLEQAEAFAEELESLGASRAFVVGE